MTFTAQHIDYENDCRSMFIGQTIRAVIYGEIKYYSEENTHPEPGYRTPNPDIDTLDHSMYFSTDNKTIYVFWDNTFISYGLQSKLIDLTETTNDFEQKWDVSNASNWAELIGKKITDFKIHWRESGNSSMDGSNKEHVVYPQTFEITTEHGKKIIISAAELNINEENGICYLMDNLLVTTCTEITGNSKLFL